MRRKIWENLAHSFKEAEDFDRRYYLSLSPEERLSDMQFCRDVYSKFQKAKDNPYKYKNADTKGLRKVIRVIQ